MLNRAVVRSYSFVVAGGLGLFGCGGASHQDRVEEPEAEPASAPVGAPLASPTGSVDVQAYVPEGYERSVAYADLAAIRESEEMEPVVEVFEEHLRSERPAAASLFTTEGLDLRSDARTAVFARPEDEREWLMTVEYADTARAREALPQVASERGRASGLEVRTVDTWDGTPPPRMASPRDGTILVGSPAAVAAVGDAAPTALTFVRTGDLAAWHLEGSTSALGVLGLEDNPPRETDVHLREAPDDGEPPLVLDAILTFGDEAEAADAVTRIREHFDRYQRNPLALIGGFRRVLTSAHVVQRGDEVDVQIRYTGDQAALLSKLLLLAL